MKSTVCNMIAIMIFVFGSSSESPQVIGICCVFGFAFVGAAAAFISVKQ